jgi:hypothetical protein
MARLLLLEPFDAPDTTSGAPEHSADWLAGHAEGVLAGLAQAMAQDARLSDEVVQTLSDMAFTYAETRTQVLASLGPLFRSLLDRFLPELVRQMLLPHILEQILTAAQVDSQRPLRLSVSPGVFRALATTLSGPMPMPVILTADAQLGDGSAIMSHGDNETALDLDGLAAGITEVLQALFDETTERKNHG